MKSFGFSLPLLLVLASCAAPQPKFKDMSTAELLLHNRTQAPMDQVLCDDEVRIGSHIRRRHCSTLRDQLEGRIGQLDTPSSSRSISGIYLGN